MEELKDSQPLVAPVKKELPEGLTDYDDEATQDPFQVTEYVKDIFSYYRAREVRIF